MHLPCCRCLRSSTLLPSIRQEAAPEEQQCGEAKRQDRCIIRLRNGSQVRGYETNGIVAAGNRGRGNVIGSQRELRKRSIGATLPSRKIEGDGTSVGEIPAGGVLASFRFWVTPRNGFELPDSLLTLAHQGAKAYTLTHPDICRRNRS